MTRLLVALTTFAVVCSATFALGNIVAERTGPGESAGVRAMMVQRGGAMVSPADCLAIGRSEGRIALSTERQHRTKDGLASDTFACLVSMKIGERAYSVNPVLIILADAHRGREYQVAFSALERQSPGPLGCFIAPTPAARVISLGQFPAKGSVCLTAAATPASLSEAIYIPKDLLRFHGANLEKSIMKTATTPAVNR